MIFDLSRGITSDANPLGRKSSGQCVGLGATGRLRGAARDLRAQSMGWRKKMYLGARLGREDDSRGGGLVDI